MFNLTYRIEFLAKLKYSGSQNGSICKKKTSAESYRLLREVYGEHAPSQDTCERCFRLFKRGDFEVADKEHRKPPKKFENVEFQALLDKDDLQTQKQLVEQLGISQQAVFNWQREMEKIQKTGRWVSSEC